MKTVENLAAPCTINPTDGHHYRISGNGQVTIGACPLGTEFSVVSIGANLTLRTHAGLPMQDMGPGDGLVFVNIGDNFDCI